MHAKVIQVGNSKGIRLPKRLLAKYDLAEEVVLKELKEGILILGIHREKLSWEDTYREMAQADEDWSGWADLDVEDLDEDQ